jgi:epoxyqueuosine reductase
MKPEPLKKEILKKCKSFGIPLVGLASVKRWKHPPEELRNVLSLSPWIPEDFWPQSIYPEAFLIQPGHSAIYG